MVCGEIIKIGGVMKNTVSGLTHVLLLIWLGFAANANAYNEGGHYYTLLALFDSIATTPTEEHLREIKLEAFCAELPDLARELDAISQRVRVLESTGDNLWGLLGRCQTNVSSHMVSSHIICMDYQALPHPS